MWQNISLDGMERSSGMSTVNIVQVSFWSSIKLWNSKSLCGGVDRRWWFKKCLKMSVSVVFYWPVCQLNHHGNPNSLISEVSRSPETTGSTYCYLSQLEFSLFVPAVVHNYNYNYNYNYKQPSLPAAIHACINPCTYSVNQAQELLRSTSAFPKQRAGSTGGNLRVWGCSVGVGGVPSYLSRSVGVQQHPTELRWRRPAGICALWEDYGANRITEQLKDRDWDYAVREWISLPWIGL